MPFEMFEDLARRLRGNEVSRQNQLDALAAIAWYQTVLASHEGDDLVARLRELERDLIRHRPKLPNDFDLTVIGEGADEIERLRERVRIYEGVMRNAKRDIDSLKQQMQDMEARRG